MTTFHNHRQTEYDINRQFLQRWSPRAFSDQPLEHEKVLALLEAGRWAPSAGNEQPWCFLLPDGAEALQQFRGLLNPSNQRWAKQAPLLLFVAGRKKWAKSGRDNATYQFDCGSAFMSLALQALHLGMYTHPMAGFDHHRSYEVLQLDKNEYEIIAAVAVGHYGDVKQLDQDLQEREKPSGRKALQEMYRMVQV